MKAKLTILSLFSNHMLKITSVNILVFIFTRFIQK